ncbi:MAG: hydantoinase/oxoprolinase family protein [Nocardioidaceae bacterium]
MSPARALEPTSNRGFSGCHLGVDVGGTFTDLVFYDDDGTTHCVKVPSNRRRPAESTLHGIAELRNRADISTSGWDRMHHTHSSTVATNALIERDGPELGMLVTEGFRDILALQRFALPHPMRFDSRRVTPLVRRRFVHEIRERVGADGTVMEPLCDDDVLAATKTLVEEGIATVVVCFLHSYRNPDHEQRVVRLIAEHAPDLHVQISSGVWPQAREYERATLTAMNAFVRPTVDWYATDLIDGLRELDISTAPRVARSNGGMELLATLRERPAAALLSGPAAGVTGAALAAAEAGWDGADLLTLDVGGTSADIGVIRAGRAVLSSEEHIADFPLLLPSIAVSAIGAGGGSVVWLQNDDTLKVGPRSVGADPGPACYGNANAVDAALSDAFVVCGLLADGQRLADRLSLQADPARAALERLGAGDATTVGAGAIRVTVAMMAAEAMNVLSRRGVDVDEFRMVAYGGAGPLVAALLADEIHVRSVLIPHTPGALSAFGAAHANLEGDLLEPVYRRLGTLTSADLNTHARALERQIDAWVHAENQEFGLPEVIVELSAEMRYDGQGYDVTVPIERQWLDDGQTDVIAAAFHRAHHATYGHSSEGADAWLNEVRAHVLGVIPKTPLRERPSHRGRSVDARRPVHLDGQQLTCAVHQRDHLAPGDTLNGPAIIEQMDTTTFVPPRWRASVQQSRHIILDRQD